MEINVIGQGEKVYKPDQIVFDVNISNVYKNYEEALVKGEESVLEFLNEMKAFGFEFQDFKTVDYRIKDETEYKNNVYKKIGTRYTRSLMLKFDYDMKKMSKMIEVASKLKNAPKIIVRYGLKDTKTAEIQLFTDAYKNAKKQADIIADAAGLKVVRCAKTSMEKENNNYYSRTNFASCEMMHKCSSTSEIMEQTYTPQDIIVEQEIFCVFIAE